MKGAVQIQFTLRIMLLLFVVVVLIKKGKWGLSS